MRFIEKIKIENKCTFSKHETIKNYKLSSFCVKEYISDGLLICNAITGEMVLLTNEEYKELASGKVIASNWSGVMAERLFLVDTELDEYAMVDYERSQGTKKGITSYTILPTSCCNAQCFYCYEKGIPHITMSSQTALDVADFISRNCFDQKVHINWFGGEPTIAHSVITLICTRLRELNVEFSSSMISNGFLLDETMIRVAKKCWKLENVQVTIDGMERVYNEVKNYKGVPSNPFATVVMNIDSLLKSGIFVSIRINLGKHNYKDVANLIDYLKECFLNTKLLSVYVHEIDNVYEKESQDELIDKTIELNNRLISMGLHKPAKLPSLRLHSCMADRDDTFVINPNGQLGKCEHYTFEKQVGSIYSSERNESVIAAWKEKITCEFCNNCPLYASCLQLKWCNGGLRCNKSIAEKKIAVVRNSMRMMYMEWKKKRQKIRTELFFVLVKKVNIRLEAGEIYADFCENENQQVLETRRISHTVCLILFFLQKEQSFQDIVNMLEENCVGDQNTVELFLEDYLMNMLQDGLIVSYTKENV